MRLRESLLRLLLPSVVGGTLTMLLLAVLLTMLASNDTKASASMFGGWWVLIGLVGWPIATLGHAAGLFVFGLPLPRLWPGAFQPGSWRGIAFNSAYSHWLFIASAAFAGFVWWRLNPDAAA